jgi:hypothetical protein
MKTIISTQTATFDFYDEFDRDDKSYYNVTIKVDLLQYEDKKQFYDISYTYKLEHNDSTHIKSSYLQMHPFYKNGTISDSADGDIVYKNDLSTMMIKYLLMPDHELSDFTNRSSTQHYRKCIMLSLPKFWD